MPLGIRYSVLLMRAKISRHRVEQYFQQLRAPRGCPLRGQQMLQVLSATPPNLCVYFRTGREAQRCRIVHFSGAVRVAINGLAAVVGASISLLPPQRTPPRSVDRSKLK